MRALWVLVVLMGGGAVATFGWGVAGLDAVAGAPVAMPWIVLAAAFAVVERYSLNVEFRGQSHSISLNDIVLVAGLFLVAPAGLVAADLVGSGTSFLLGRGRTALKVAFNLAHLVLGSAVAVVIFRAFARTADPYSGRTWLAAFAATAAVGVIGNVATTVAITVSEGKLNRARALRTSMFGLASSAANTTLGLVTIIVMWQRPLATTLLVAPMVVVFVAYRAYLSERAKSEALQSSTTPRSSRRAPTTSKTGSSRSSTSRATRSTRNSRRSCSAVTRERASGLPSDRPRSRSGWPARTTNSSSRCCARSRTARERCSSTAASCPGSHATTSRPGRQCSHR